MVVVDAPLVLTGLVITPYALLGHLFYPAEPSNRRKALPGASNDSNTALALIVPAGLFALAVALLRNG
jgi:hypothetical protein